MKKSTLLPALVFLILGGGLFMLLTNAHVDLFSGTEKQYDNFYMKEEVKQKSVSLLAVSRGDATLDTKGWLTAGGVIGGFPLLLAFLIKRRLVRKEKRHAQLNENKV